MVLRLGALRKKHLIPRVKKRKIVGKCDHCKDPIYDFQKKVEMHEGCVELEALDGRTVHGEG